LLLSVTRDREHIEKSVSGQKLFQKYFKMKDFEMMQNWSYFKKYD